jgi:hypothetical protein
MKKLTPYQVFDGIMQEIDVLSKDPKIKEYIELLKTANKQKSQLKALIES